MKISWKIFIVTYCMILLTTALGGFWLVNSMYKRDLEQTMQEQQMYNKTIYSYIVMMRELPDTYADYSLTNLLEGMSVEEETEIFVGNFWEWEKKWKGDSVKNLENGQYCSAVIEENGVWKLQVTSRYEEQYIINEHDITEIMVRRDENYALYQRVVILSSALMAILLNLFAHYVTRPLEKVTEMANQVAKGDYTARVNASYAEMKSYEASRLGSTLNFLTENTQQHIQELQEESRRKEEFMANFTHELKTPLTSIIGYADLLRTYDLGPEKRREYSAFIYREGKRLEQLSLNLLQLIVLEKTSFDCKEISMAQLARELKEQAKFLQEKYRVKIMLSLEEGIVYAEPALFTTVIINLIDNACKASREGQVIAVTGVRSQEMYQVQVIDNGRGIPKAELEKIAEPFYMVDKSRARSQGGAGLGLTLCKKIVELHGGELIITSREGEGTSVLLLIPQKGVFHES